PGAADPVPLEQATRSPGVLAKDEVGLGELTEHPHRDVLEIPDRSRADGERHRLTERLEGDERGADHAGQGTELRGNDPHGLAGGGERLAAHDLPRWLEHELPGRRSD